MIRASPLPLSGYIYCPFLLTTSTSSCCPSPCSSAASSSALPEFVAVFLPVAIKQSFVSVCHSFSMVESNGWNNWFSVTAFSYCTFTKWFLIQSVLLKIPSQYACLWYDAKMVLAMVGGQSGAKPSCHSKYGLIFLFFMARYKKISPIPEGFPSLALI